MNQDLKKPWMMCFTRTGLLRFISHLDWLAMVERILTRAQLPVAYSEGYHRRPIMKASPPLPTGAASQCELLQIFLDGVCDPKDVAQRLMASVPEDVTLKWAQAMRFKPQKNPYKAIAAAEYRYEFRAAIPGDRRERLLSLLESLKPGPDGEIDNILGPDPGTLKPIAGRLIAILNSDEYLNGNIDHIRLIGQMDASATLHAAKLGFFLYESVPLTRYPLITKLTHLRKTDSGYEPVFVR